MTTARNHSAVSILVILVVLVGCISRFVALDADPHYSGWWGHVIDEGRWLRRARSLALGNLSEQDLGGHNSGVAPAFEAASYLSFRMFGVGRASARNVSALCGSLILIGLWCHFRSRVSDSAQLAAFAVVAFQAHMFVLSRLAVPEVAAMLASLVTFIVIVSAPLQRRWFVVAGIGIALTLAIKVTTVGLVPIFGLLIWLRRPAGAGWQVRLRDLTAFWMVAALAALLAVVIGLFKFNLDNTWLASRIGIFLGFVQPNDLYSMISVWLGKDALPLIPPLLGLGAATLSLLLFPRTDASDDLGYACLASTVWSIGLLLLITVLAYYPVRYQIHVLVPLALCTAYGVTRLTRAGLTSISAALSVSTGMRRTAALLVLVLPNAVLVATVASGIVGLLGVPSDRTIVRFTLVASLTLVLYIVSRRKLTNPTILGVFLAAPVAGSLVWFTIWIFHPGAVGFWSDVPSVTETGIRGLLAVAAIGFAVLAVKWRARSPTSPLVCFAVVWLVISAIHIAPGVFEPRFTMRDASIDLGRTIEHSSSVTSYKIQGIFLDNSLAYKNWTRSNWNNPEEDHPDVIVSLLDDWTPVYSDRGYELVKVYDIYLPNLYNTPPPVTRPDICPDQKGICVAVYRLGES